MLINTCMERPTNATRDREARYLGFRNRAAGELLLPSPPHPLAQSYISPGMKHPP